MIQRTREELFFSFEEISEILKDKVSDHRNCDIENLSVTYCQNNSGDLKITVHYDSGEFDGGSYT